MIFYLLISYAELLNQEGIKEQACTLLRFVVDSQVCPFGLRELARKQVENFPKTLQCKGLEQSIKLDLQDVMSEILEQFDT